MAEDDLEADFIAVKIGDVNGSAAANFMDNEIEDRSGNIFWLETPNRTFRAGEAVTMDITAASAGALLGWQFTMDFDATALEFNNLQAGAIGEEFFGMSKLDEGAITASWNTDAQDGIAFRNDEILFSLEFTALKDGSLNEVLALNSRFTAAEAYAVREGDVEWTDIALDFGAGTLAANFTLHQNEPNPFRGATNIAFELPAASEATLTIMDMSGKVLQAIDGDFVKGLNVITLKENDIPATASVLYYRLDTPTHSAMRKMIMIK